MWFCTLNLKQRAVWSSWNPLISRPSIIYNIFPLINLSNYVLHWFKKMLTIIKGGTMSAFKPKQRARSTFSSAASAILGGIPMQTILSALAICLSSSSSMWRSVQSRPCCMTTYETLICSLTKNFLGLEEKKARQRNEGSGFGMESRNLCPVERKTTEQLNCEHNNMTKNEGKSCK